MWLFFPNIYTTFVNEEKNRMNSNWKVIHHHCSALKTRSGTCTVGLTTVR